MNISYSTLWNIFLNTPRPKEFHGLTPCQGNWASGLCQCCN